MTEQATQDTTTARISHAIERAGAGERDAAKRELAAVWDGIGPGGDPLDVCTLAHFMADLCDDVHDELAWDLLALGAASSVTDERVRESGASSARGLYPSLHLNVGDAYRRLGDVPRAREHCERGRAATDALGEDGYGRMITGGLDRLAERWIT